MANPTLPTPPAENEDPWWPTRSAFDAAVKLAVETQLAALDSPVFTGTPSAPTPTTGDNDTTIATTAFVKAQGYATLASPFPAITAGESVWWTGPPNAGTRALGVGTIAYRPLVVGRRCRITAFRFNVTTAAATATLSVGLYGTSDGTDIQGGAHLATLANAVDSSTTGTKDTTGLTVDVEPGMYWLGYLNLGAAITVAGATSDPLNVIYQPHREATNGRAGGLTGDAGLSSLPSVGAIPDTWDSNSSVMWFSLQTTLIP